jgi:hypothetical protein
MLEYMFIFQALNIILTALVLTIMKGQNDRHDK